MELMTEIKDLKILGQNYCYRDGFVFTSISEPANIYDAILIRTSNFSDVSIPKLGFSSKSLEDHIALINRHKIRKAIIITDNLNFILDCPFLEQFKIFYVDMEKQKPDFSPLYKIEKIVSLDFHFCSRQTVYHPTVDCSKLSGLKELWVRDSNVSNYDQIASLEELYLFNCGNIYDMNSISKNENIKKISCVSCGELKSLNGIENLEKLQWLDFSFCKKLGDISALAKVHKTLRLLSIEKCPLITDFSSLVYLDKMEYLELNGNNKMDNINFMSAMKELQMFLCTMNIEDGNITPCLSVPYVDLKNYKHYNIKNNKLTKNINPQGFQLN